MKIDRLGIIGAENSHSWNVASIANIRQISRLRVTHIWGETPEFAKAAAEKGRIPHIVSDWKKLAGEVDAVMIDHRHGKLHEAPARYFIEKGIPVFVDKPMTCGLESSKALLDLGQKKGVPVLTFSSKPKVPAFRQFVAKVEKTGAVAAYSSCGPCDLKSRYGGVFFYGIHQVDCAVELLGTDVESASLIANGKNGVAVLRFKGGVTASLDLVGEFPVSFHYRATTDKGIISAPDKPDPQGYRSTVVILSKFVKDGTVPFSRKRMLAPIAILDALQKSLRSGKTEKVGNF
jgi:predicted dehydrogenase